MPSGGQTTIGIQNVAGVNTNQGFFYFGGSENVLTVVQPGWYAQGENMVNAPVTAASYDSAASYITIQSPNLFLPGRFYYFTEFPLPVANVCFPAKTPVVTNQGIVDIDKIDKMYHTIRSKKIVAITQTVSKSKYLICFEENSIATNVPSRQTVISTNHEIFYDGKMMKAIDFVGLFDGVRKVANTGEILYNVLLEDHDKMVVNNLIVETLHPENGVAKLYTKLNIDDVDEIQRAAIIFRVNKAIEDIDMKNNFVRVA